MPVQRFLLRRKLAPEHVADYLHYHQNVPVELMDAYKRAGVINLSCFLYENDLIVYMEVDQEVYDQEKGKLAQNPIESNWQNLMSTLNDSGFLPVRYEEVFRM